MKDCLGASGKGCPSGSVLQFPHGHSCSHSCLQRPSPSLERVGWASGALRDLIPLSDPQYVIQKKDPPSHSRAMQRLRGCLRARQELHLGWASQSLSFPTGTGV